MKNNNLLKHYICSIILKYVTLQIILLLLYEGITMKFKLMVNYRFDFRISYTCDRCGDTFYVRCEYCGRGSCCCQGCP